jgi:hypothetical protein
MAGRKATGGEVAAVPRLLDLDAEEMALDADRMGFVSGGKTYFLKMPQEFAMAPKETLRMLLLQQRQVIATPPTLRDGDDGMPYAEREALLDSIESRIMRMALHEPDGDIDLSPYARNRIIKAFTEALGDELLPLVIWLINQQVERLETLIAEIAQQLNANNSEATGETGNASVTTTNDSPPPSSTAIAAD